MPCNITSLPLETVMLYRFRGYASPAIASFGIIGNIIVLILFGKMQHRQASRFNLYVIFIAFSQTVDLIINGFLDDFLGRGLTWLSDCSFFIKLDVSSSFACKFFSYVPKITSFLSNALLVLFSFDRLLTAYEPFRFRGDRRMKIAVWIIVLTIVVGAISFFPQVIHTDLIVQRKKSLVGRTSCEYVDSRHPAVQYVLYWSIVGTYLIPSVTITIINVLIVVKLRSQLRERYRITAHSRHSPSEMHRITGHLILTTIFLFLTFPLVVVIVLRQQSDFAGYSISRPVYAKRLVDLSKLFSSFDAITYSSQFPIYLIFLPNFRHAMIRLLCSSRCMQNTAFGAACLRMAESDVQSRPMSVRSGSRLFAKFMQAMVVNRNTEEQNCDSV